MSDISLVWLSGFRPQENLFIFLKLKKELKKRIKITDQAFSHAGS